MRKKTYEDLEVRKEVADRFNELLAELKNRGVSLSELANSLGVTENTLFLYKTAKAFPSPRVLKLLGTVFKVNLHWLLTGEDDEIIFDTPPKYMQKEKKYYVGNKLSYLMYYFGISFIELFELLPLETPNDLEKVLKNEIALPESMLKQIAYIFALQRNWYKRQDYLRFNTKAVFFVEKPVNLKNVYTVFANECSSDNCLLKFAVWQKVGRFGGVLLYDKLDYLFYPASCRLRDILLKQASEQGAYFKLLSRETFDKLTQGLIHPVKVEGLPLEFPFLQLVREKPPPQLDYREYLGKPSYGLAKFLYLLSECK